ncbi:hypothetical protein BLA9940_03602 [Burkholderia aenigmatica]|nr:hypothetical protein BLA9940_03602 [Burkholderia aenigmatica]
MIYQIRFPRGHFYTTDRHHQTTISYLYKTWRSHLIAKFHLLISDPLYTFTSPRILAFDASPSPTDRRPRGNTDSKKICAPSTQIKSTAQLKNNSIAKPSPHPSFRQKEVESLVTTDANPDRPEITHIFFRMRSWESHFADPNHKAQSANRSQRRTLTSIQSSCTVRRRGTILFTKSENVGATETTSSTSPSDSHNTYFTSPVPTSIQKSLSPASPANGKCVRQNLSRLSEYFALSPRTFSAERRLTSLSSKYFSPI